MLVVHRINGLTIDRYVCSIKTHNLKLEHYLTKIGSTIDVEPLT